jgi:hypothetical protein
MSEWLRRQIRNLLGIARVGSSPAGVDKLFDWMMIEVLLLLNSLLSYILLDASIFLISTSSLFHRFQVLVSWIRDSVLARLYFGAGWTYTGL